VRALARSDRPSTAWPSWRRAGARRPRRPPALRAGATTSTRPFPSPPGRRPGGAREDFERINVGAPRTSDGGARSCRGAWSRGHRGALMKGPAARQTSRGAPLLPIPRSRTRARRPGRAGCARGERPGARDRRHPSALRRGRGDTTLLPASVDIVKAGRFRWVARPPSVGDTHIDNTSMASMLGVDQAPARPRPTSAPTGIRCLAKGS